MSLVLTDKEKNKLLTKKKFTISQENLLKNLEFSSNIFLKFIINSEISQNNLNYKELNPLIWQYGHVIFFYINHVIKNLEKINPFTIYYDKINFYDSFITNLELRNDKNNLLKFDECKLLYINVIAWIKNYICKNNLNYKINYLITLGILHNEMHNEAFIFTNFKLNLKTDINYIIIKKNILIKDIEFINYKSGSFIHGSKKNKKKFIFDNEIPSFKKKIKEFSISKYPITEYMYTQFIINNGYSINKYWSQEGINWKKKNNIKLPLYWIKEKNIYYKLINGQKYNTLTNLPMSNISFYEANAYCKWRNLRLPTESEYEYMATNKGKTLYPWGNLKPNNNLCNINYKNNIVEVNSFLRGDNFLGVSQLIGNIWEWCQEPIYPYDGFIIDPIYREMSYPFFGYKIICKGGSFAVSDFLIHPNYRNAQYPDCRIQFIGFRVCKI